METRYYEGCGREGPIRCIFLSEFHPIEGPKITCQFPDDYLSKDVFDAVSVYIIPKPQLQKCTMTINALGHKIIGYPIRIDSTRYERNAYLFNLCFVCDSWSRTVQYETVVKKLSEHLKMMEEETRFVSNGSSRLPTLLAHLLHDLNTHRKATVLEGDTVMHLKVVEVRNDPPAVLDSDVPIFASAVGLPRPGRPPRTPPPANGQPGKDQHFRYEERLFHVDPDDEWDLTTRQLLGYINGYNHVLKIAAEADIEKTLVKSCIQNLVYYGVVLIMPLLKFSNMYRATPTMSRMFGDAELQAACLGFITPLPGSCGASDAAGQGKPMFSDALEILCALQQGTTLKAVCERFPSSRDGTLDVRRLVIFALLHKFIKCLKRVPVYTGQRAGGGAGGGAVLGAPARRREWAALRRLFTGAHCVDEICCMSGVELPLLEQLIDEDPDVTIIWR